MWHYLPQWEQDQEYFTVELRFIQLYRVLEEKMYGNFFEYVQKMSLDATKFGCY